METESGPSASRTRRATVVLPEPDPPATPITRRLCLASSPADGGAAFAPSPAVSATLPLYQTLEGQVMSSTILGGFTTARRIAIGAALAASLGLTAYAAADQQVTALLRNGDRVTGRFDGLNQNLLFIDVSDTDERKIPMGDVALI